MRRRLLILPFLISLLVLRAAFAQQPGAEVARALQLIDRYQQSAHFEDAAEAARVFSLAIRANRDDAWAHYGLGLTLLRARKTMVVVRRYGGLDGEAIFVAKRALEKALELRPDFTEAAEALARIAEATEDTKRLARARDVLTKSANSGEAVGRADLALNDTAAIMARTPVTAMDYLRRALVLFSRNEDRAGADAYYAGVEHWDDETVGSFVRDVEIIASEPEKLALKAATRADRAEALRMFWKKRAVRDGVPMHERIGEHYRRLSMARQLYKRTERRGAPGIGAIHRPHETGVASEIDDRGVIYVRYGEPMNRSSVNNAITRANETWVYRQPDGSLEHFRFAALEMASGYQLVSTPVAMLNFDYRIFQEQGGWLTLASNENFANAAHFFDEQGRYDPKWRLLAGKLQILNSQLRIAMMNPENRKYELTISDLRTNNLAWSKQYENEVRAALMRDLGASVFLNPLRVFHDFATFRGRGCTDLVYTLAAPGPAYRVLVNVSDTLTWETETVDTLVSKETPAGTWLRSTGSICTKPNPDAYVRFTIAANDRTGANSGGSLAIEDYSGRALMMSDLLFATPDDGPFVRGNARLALVPPRQFKQNEPFRVFYELYNLPAGGRYNTEISLETVETNPFAVLYKGKKKTAVSFEGDAQTGDVVQELRTLIPEIEPGRVVITIAVTDRASGRSTKKSETIWILPADADDAR